MIKKDGHTHTQFSHHGSLEDVAVYIERAIALGFEEYVVTEHAPLPADFVADNPQEAQYLAESSMTPAEAELYFEQMAHLTQRFADKITLKTGLEVDYLVGYETQTQAILDQYAPQLDEVVLSVHFMPNQNGLIYGIDGDPETIQREFLVNMTADQLFKRYYDTILASVKADLNLPAVVRVGHLTLIRKFQRYFDFPAFTPEIRTQIANILAVMQHKNYQLDVNAAGLFKLYAQEIYPDFQTLKQAAALEIPLIYGSDAHEVAAVGQGYAQVETQLKMILK